MEFENDSISWTEDSTTLEEGYENTTYTETRDILH